MLRSRECVTVHAHAGTQTNCGGYAKISARVEWVDEAGVSLINAYRGRMRGRLIAAVFAGAQRVLEEARDVDGLRFTLIDAVVHPVDATEQRFYEAGEKAMRAALVELLEDCRGRGAHWSTRRRPVAKA
ncbi:MAG: hypothetical protein KC636_33615 [Myxococcales bacterium]|nr:hypothetical protein [Myxococcales bacterium]